MVDNDRELEMVVIEEAVAAHTAKIKQEGQEHQKQTPLQTTSSSARTSNVQSS